MTTQSLPDLIAETDAVTDAARRALGGLSSEQLNWKPSAEAWSVGQCLDHLIKTNEPYFPIFEQLIRGERRATLWEKVPLLPSLFGRLLINAVAPTSPRKIKARPSFHPSASAIDGNIVEVFAARQQTLTTLMRQLEGVDVRRIVITSPVLGIVTYSVLDACTVVVRHEQRHFAQAERVLAAEGFPRAKAASG